MKHLLPLLMAGLLGACSILPQSEPLDIYLLPGSTLPAQQPGPVECSMCGADAGAPPGPPPPPPPPPKPRCAENSARRLSGDTAGIAGLTTQHYRARTRRPGRAANDAPLRIRSPLSKLA